MVDRVQWRQGYAQEALVDLSSTLIGPLGVRSVEAEVNPANTASNQLLRELGFTHAGLLRLRWVATGQIYDTNRYGCLASECAPPATLD